MTWYVTAFALLTLTELINWQVITYLARTPLTKARKGGLKDTTVDDLLISLLTVLFFLH
jgi:hypothetical protein